MSTEPSEQLETFPNPAPERDYTIHISTHEFTCLCPKTGQPDFATLEFDYIADELCVELKALKLYIWAYRDKGAFHEAVTNKILLQLSHPGLCVSQQNLTSVAAFTQQLLQNIKWMDGIRQK